MQSIRGNELLGTKFLSVTTPLRLLLTLPITVCENERSFSNLTLINSR